MRRPRVKFAPRIAAVTMLPIAALAAPGDPLPPSSVPRATVRPTVPSGIATIVGDVTRWGRECQPLPPTLVLVEAPQHGTTSILDTAAAIPARDANGAPVACAGRPTVRKALYYRSTAGFYGADHLAYDTEHGRYTVEITIR